MSWRRWGPSAGGPAGALAKAFGITLHNNTILTKGADGKPTGELTIDVNKSGERQHPLFDRVLRIVYVVGESMEGPGVILRAPDGSYSGPTAEATDGPSAAGSPLMLAFDQAAERHTARAGRLTAATLHARLDDLDEVVVDRRTAPLHRPHRVDPASW